MLNGGAFGVEAGLVATVVLLAATVIIWKTKTVDIGALQLRKAAADAATVGDRA